MQNTTKAIIDGSNGRLTDDDALWLDEVLAESAYPTEEQLQAKLRNAVRSTRRFK